MEIFTIHLNKQTVISGIAVNNCEDAFYGFPAQRRNPSIFTYNLIRDRTRVRH